MYVFFYFKIFFCLIICIDHIRRGTRFKKIRNYSTAKLNNNIGLMFHHNRPIYY